MRSHTRLAAELDAVRALPRIELVKRWQKAFGCDPPKGVKRGLLERSAAWHLQARRLSGFSSQTKAELRRVDREAPLNFGEDNNGIGSTRTGPRSKPHPGTRLIREWNGQTYVVDVTEDGLTLDGTSYGSLSAIARHITGARWSGPRFFGL